MRMRRTERCICVPMPSMSFVPLLTDLTRLTTALSFAFALSKL